MNANATVAGAFFEVFAHPDTAAELEQQSATGVLKVNGCRAVAAVVDRLGNGDHIVRIVLREAA